MSCNNLFPAIPKQIYKDATYFEELLFSQVLKNKIITDESFDFLYSMKNGFSIESISDTNGNFQFKYEKTEDGNYKCIIDNTEKKHQLKIDYYNPIRGKCFLIIDYKIFV